ncbi:MAG: bifunctional [glutamate--ammonia ligase]-adenylyl-L-tyrosine phosphorylase/[glutamate--ammonia-ligase] adenylyltransferase, partial [Deltaproteobacteria bacterium]
MNAERLAKNFTKLIEHADSAERQRGLASFLESQGFTYGERSADNILLLYAHFSAETLYRILSSSLMTPSPDFALNAFERLAGVIPQEDLVEISRSKKTLSQFVLLCGSSPFLVSLMFKAPSAFRQLLL